MRRFALCTALALIVGFGVVGAQERVDQDVLWKIRREATLNSRVMPTLHMLTDVYGPRLTGSPNLKAASDWALKQMAEWGMTNGHLEPWDFGHPGWVNERLAAHIVSPVKDALVVEALAWTPGTNGPARASTVSLEPPLRATRAEMTKYLDGIGDRVKGRMVLVGEPQKVLVAFNPPVLRQDDATILGRLNQPAAPAPTAPPPPPPAAPKEPGPNDPLTFAQRDEMLNDFLVARGALVRVNDAGRAHGQIRAFNNRTYDLKRAPATVVMRNEDYGRIWRLMNGVVPGETKRQVELEFDIVNREYPEGRTVYNVIAEIPGSDKADQVIMLGGHLDSWHAGTGATDNAVGVTIMMEAARILKAIGVKPRRTVRVAMWSGEEQGLLGSQAYVKQHYGTVEEPKPEFATFGGYFNIDSGTGKVRSWQVFGPQDAAKILSEATASLTDLGLLGASATRSRNRGGTDSTSFNFAGLPGIDGMQDPIEYGLATWHTNLDTYERIIEDDVQKSAIMVAAAVYDLAMRDELLPRLTAKEMPPKPAEPPPPTTPAKAPAPASTAAPAPASPQPQRPR